MRNPTASFISISQSIPCDKRENQDEKSLFMSQSIGQDSGPQFLDMNPFKHHHHNIGILTYSIDVNEPTRNDACGGSRGHQYKKCPLFSINFSNNRTGYDWWPLHRCLFAFE
jgi:hypothetical protein